ncbi:hypothetical protein QDY66_02840 [Kingella negevensis]|uniref:hypothetical protein n=1 Tax=Kingella negevensis TaxID=1522312 RepID=UPI00254CEFFB|nr:hypothetical protein [Kingella negevensis]MDK4698922.1 hypothetical protein [Kingella negevensis]
MSPQKKQGNPWQVRSAFQLDQSGVETLADKIRYLGNTTPAAAKGIMENCAARGGHLVRLQVTTQARSQHWVRPCAALVSRRNCGNQYQKHDVGIGSRRNRDQIAKGSVEKIGILTTRKSPKICKKMQKAQH